MVRKTLYDPDNFPFDVTFLLEIKFENRLSSRVKNFLKCFEEKNIPEITCYVYDSEIHKYYSLKDFLNIEKFIDFLKIFTKIFSLKIIGVNLNFMYEEPITRRDEMLIERDLYSDVNLSDYDNIKIIDEILKVEEMEDSIYKYLRLLKSTLKNINRQKDKKQIEKNLKTAKLPKETINIIQSFV